MEITITLQPKQKEALRVADRTPVTFFGGAKGGGKSHLVRARETIRRLKYPNSRGLIVRKTYPELLANHIRPFFKEYPQTREWYNKAEKTIYWPTGSTTEFSYLRATDDVYTYQGREYEDISVDEVTQHEWEVINVLRSSNRTTLDNIKPTMFLTGNPGGIGHQEVKRVFIDRDFRQGEIPEDFAFVQAFVQDNIALMEKDPDYIKRLENLPEHLVRAYLYGDWNIFAGQAFGELRRDKHLVEPFTPPESAKYFAGYDWGFSHPFAFVLMFITQNEDIYVKSVVSAPHKKIEEQAKLIKNIVGDKHLNVYAGTDIWAKRGGPTMVQDLRQQLPNLSFIQANTDRVQGIAQLRKLISVDGGPKFKIFKNAYPVYENLLSMQYDEKNPEDVLKVDANESGIGGDDKFDACFPWFIKVKKDTKDICISKINSGDTVKTSSGHRKVVKSWLTGVRGLRLMVTSKGKVLLGTNNHPIKTSNGFVRLDTIRYGDIIETWQNHKQSNSMESNIGDTQRAIDCTCKDTITQAETIRRRGLRLIIERFIRSIMEKSQKVITFTTRTVIGTIITQTTSKPYQQVNTYQSIQDRLRNLGSMLIGSGPLHLNGTNQKKGKNGTQKWPKKLGNIRVILSKIVISATKSIRQGIEEKIGFAHQLARQNTGEIISWIIYKLIVVFVGIPLRLQSIVRQRHAPERVLVNLGLPIKTKVYNLEVDKTPEYFANNILVHNCRYGVNTFLNPKILKSKKPDPLSGQALLDKVGISRRMKIR